MAVFTNNLNTAVKPADVQVSLAPNNMSMRYEFQQWLTDGNTRKYTPEVVLSCMDRISEYAVRKKIATNSLWEYAHYNAFSPIYKKLIEAKMLRITDRNTHKVFITAGQLYLRFLKDKLFARREAISDEAERELSVVPEQLTKYAIDPEDVVAWLVTQPNANGTLYLENVVRQYMGALRTAPTKLDIPVVLEVKSVFVCKTPADLNAYWEIFRSAPNYKQVNSSTSGMFSAALNCYMRYLQHLTDGVHVTEIIDVSEAQTETEKAFVASEVQKYNKFRTVDFNYPERCAQTKPVSCIICGQAVVPSKQNWSQLLVAITEWFIEADNSNLALLDHSSLYGSKVFFLPQKADFGTCAKLSTGKWIYTNYNPQTVVTIIGNLCRHCGVNLDDVVITYEPKGGKTTAIARTITHPASIQQSETPRLVLDNAVVEQLTGVLSMRYSNGFRLNSPIEMTRFRSFAAEDLNGELTLSDDELKAYISACGICYEGKVYAVSAETRKQIKKLAEDYFADGAQAIFFAEYYAKNEDWLFGASVVSEEMLTDIFADFFRGFHLRRPILVLRTPLYSLLWREKFSECGVEIYC